LNGLQRRFARLSLATAVTLQPLQPYPPAPLATIEISVDTLSKAAKATPKAKPRELDSNRLAQTVLLIMEEQVLSTGQVIAIDFEGTKLELTVHSLATVDLQKKKKKPKEGEPKKEETAPTMGQLLQPTDLRFLRAPGTTAIVLTGDHIAEGEGGGAAQSIFVGDFDFEKLGIGGLDAEFNQIFRRAFASRIWPAHIIKQMGIAHVRGMLLFGPPGCGKVRISLSLLLLLLQYYI
jgi:vesicle-fusing ATPase